MKHIILSLSLLLTLQAFGQKKLIQVDTVKPKPPVSVEAESPDKPKSYEKIITDKAVTMKGLFTVHKIEEKYFWEIPDSVLGRDILMVTRLSKSPEQGLYDTRPYYAGDQLDQKVIRFELTNDNRVFVRSISNLIRSSDSTENGIYRSLKNSTVQPILISFPVKAFNTKAASSVIEITDFIGNDNSLLTIPSLFRPVFKVGMFFKDRSAIVSVKAFSMNVEVKTMKTYASALDMGGAALTFEFSNSFVLLPKVPMKSRKADARVGYFNTGFIDFDRVKETYLITRWRLEPKPQDVERYLKGELVEPQKPIVIYIDPATPKKWVPYLIKGVNDWQVAFEQAGFKNAIYAIEAPTDDSTWSLEDATHSAIVYKPSLESNAMGPHIHDPRSGEILETHIQWYHNVMKLLQNWYMLQAGAIDPRARTLDFDDDLMGELIRFVSSHEVGHTLGLMHNFGASSSVPVDSLRNKRWVEKYGHTPSIMDYARFNYIAQPEDSIGARGIYPRIGDYDKWAIEWGYRYFSEFKDDREEQTFMNNWIIRSIKDKRLRFGPQTVFTVSDPRNQSEDLGDDAMKAGSYGIKNLKRILPELMRWTSTPNQGYASFTEKYDKLVTQVYIYAGHVLNNIGGYYRDSKTVEQEGLEFSPIPKVHQKRAMEWLNKEIFTTPDWLSDELVLQRADPYGSQLQQLGAVVLTNLIGRTVLMSQANRLFAKSQQYELKEFWSDLKSVIWKELKTGAKTDLYRRNLQSIYITSILGVLTSPQADKPDLNSGDYLSVLYVHATQLLQDMQASLPLIKDDATYAHLKFTINRFKKGLERDKVNSSLPPNRTAPNSFETHRMNELTFEF